jgi:ubiquitin C-terminal hydrolase
MNKNKSIVRKEDDDEFIVDPYKLLYDKNLICCKDYHIKKKKNCHNNPWCIYGLGENKEGLWLNPPNNIMILGNDPTKHFREINSESKYSLPVGLKNLGATCYLNVLMQVHNIIILFLSILILF